MIMRLPLTWRRVQERVQLGVMPELVELAQINGVKGYRARQLYNGGLRTVKDVADCTTNEIAAILTRGRTGKLFHGCRIWPILPCCSAASVDPCTGRGNLMKHWQDGLLSELSLCTCFCCSDPAQQLLQESTGLSLTGDQQLQP